MGIQIASYAFILLLEGTYEGESLEKDSREEDIC